MAKRKPKKKAKVRAGKKTGFSVGERALGFAELGRPVEWSKSLLNMWLAAMMAYYVFSFTIDFGLFVAGFISVAALWSALYALNDYTDRALDAKHKVKKKRPIPSGRVSPNQGLAFVIILLAVSFGIAYALGRFLLGLCLLVMLANQLLYTVKPFRLKSRKYFDFVSGSMVNPVFRYFSGMVLFVPAGVLFSNFSPLLPLIFVICMQFSGYSLYRLFSKKDDKKFKMSSSVAKISEEKVKIASYFALGVAFLAYLSLLLNGLYYKFLWLGYLPRQFSWAVILVLLFLPLLKDAILRPGKASMGKAYRTIYIANLVFIAANIVIFVFVP